MKKKQHNLLSTLSLAIFLLSVFLFISPFTIDAAISITGWSSVKEMPFPAMFFTGEIVNGKIYTFGGRNDAWTPSYTDIIREYDPSVNEWVIKNETISSPRAHLSSAVVNNKIYLFGGVGVGGSIPPYGDTVDEYDPLTGIVTVKAPMPTPRRNPGVAAVDGIIYVIGGIDHYQVRTENEAYNPINDAWETKQSIPGAMGGRELFGCVAIGTKIFVFGGSSFHSVYQDVWIYDTQTDSWSSKNNMPEPRYCYRAVASDGKVYIASGISGGPIFLTSVWEYDPLSDTYTRITDGDLPFSRIAGTAVTLDGYIYILGGQISDWSFTPIVHRSIPVIPPPDITVSPLTYDYEYVEVGDTATTVVTISNDGESDLVIDDLVLVPSGASLFYFSSEPDLPLTLPPGWTVDVEITFVPQLEGSTEANFIISSDDPDESIVEVNLTGTGVTEIYCGDYNDNIEVGPGEIVVIGCGTFINGNIDNEGGMVIVKEGSSINGNIKAWDGGDVSITGSSYVNGTVEAWNGSDVSILDGSEIVGNVKVKDSGCVLEITYSTVGGNIETEGIDSLIVTNSVIGGNIISKGDKEVIIENNIVTGEVKIE